MGHLLDLVRETEVTVPLGETRAAVADSGWGTTRVILPMATPEPPFDTLAAAVLDVVVQAGQPVSHPSIVTALMGRGHGRTSARQAIARCQKWQWIEHDLATGYMLV